MRIGDGIAVMNHEKLLSSAHIAQREAHVVGMQIVGVLYDFNQSLEGLDVQVFGRRRGALQATFAALRRTKMRRSVRALEGINQPRIALAFPAALRSSSIFGFGLSVLIVSDLHHSPTRFFLDPVRPRPNMPFATLILFRFAPHRRRRRILILSQ
jgi:hypothetical protein